MKDHRSGDEKIRDVDASVPCAVWGLVLGFVQDFAWLEDELLRDVMTTRKRPFERAVRQEFLIRRSGDKSHRLHQHRPTRPFIRIASLVSSLMIVKDIFSGFSCSIRVFGR